MVSLWYATVLPLRSLLYDAPRTAWRMALRGALTEEYLLDHSSVRQPSSEGAAAIASDHMNKISFRMPVTDVYTFGPDHAVILGTVQQGQIATGDAVLLTVGSEEVRVPVSGLEVFGAIITRATAGQEIGMQVKGVDPKLIPIGSIVKSADSN